MIAAASPAFTGTSTRSENRPSFVNQRGAVALLSVAAFAIVLAAAPYKTFDLDRYFVSKELVLNAAAFLAALIVARRVRRVTLTAVDMLLLAFLGWSVVSAVFASNYWAAQRALAISFSGVAVFWLTSAIRRSGNVRPLIVALAAAVVVGAATSLAQAHGVDSRYFSLNRSPGGTFGNRNFVAHLSAIGTPVVVLVALTAKRGLGSLLGAGGMTIVAATLVLSRSRAAWLAVLVLSAPVVIMAFLTRERWREPRTVRRLMLMGGAAVTGVIGALVLPNRLEWKSDSPYLDSAAGLVNYKQGSGAGRLVQYANSLKMTKADPVFGVGPGNWPVNYPRFASRNDPSMSQSEGGLTSNPWPSSDWVAYLSERGVVGLGLLVFAMLGLFVRAVRDVGSSRSRDPARVLTAIAVVGTLTATAVVGAFDAVLMLAVPSFFVFALAGALAPPGGRGVTVSRGVRPMIVALLVFGAVSVVRSSTQLIAMATFDAAGSRVSALERAAWFDPGSYRIQVRVAAAQRSRGNCAQARDHARAARDLFPAAGEPKRILTACGARKVNS